MQSTICYLSLLHGFYVHPKQLVRYFARGTKDGNDACKNR